MHAIARWLALLEFPEPGPNIGNRSRSLPVPRQFRKDGALRRPFNRHDKHNAMTLQMESAVTVRLDVWLWAARFFKTRSLAKHAVDTGKVDVAGQRPKPSRAVRTGEQLRIDRGGEIFEITVAALSEARGPAPVAQALYTETEASREARAQWRLQRAAERTGYRPPDGKPDKRARRLITALGDIDAL